MHKVSTLWQGGQHGVIPMKEKEAKLELDLHIEELEDRLAPDGGETVLPLPLPTIRFER